MMAGPMPLPEIKVIEFLAEFRSLRVPSEVEIGKSLEQTLSTRSE
jgi:hypothetical protein